MAERDADWFGLDDSERHSPPEPHMNPQTGLIEPADETPQCERCEKRPVSEACEEGLYCDVCLENMAEAAAEAAHERAFTSYWEGDGPPTLEEEYQAAWKQKQELNR